MPRIVFPDFSNISRARIAGEPFPYLAMDVVYIPIPAADSYYGSYFNRDGQPDYYVARADNRRILGTIERACDELGRPEKSTWMAWPRSDAFRGDHFDDASSYSCMDEVPSHLSHSPRKGFGPLGGHHSTRDDAAEELLKHLYSNYAPAMGFGRNGDVHRYDSPLRESAKPTRRAMKAGPYPTVAVRDEWGIDNHIVPDGATPLRFDNREKAN